MITRAHRELRKHLPSLWRRFCHDQRGVISILGVFAILVGLGLSAVVIDVGHLYLTKRRLQSAVDAAALAAASNPGNAAVIVSSTLALNGYDATRLAVQAGRYTPDTTRAASDRLDTDPGPDQPLNAVRITKTISTPDFFAGILRLAGMTDIMATATAAQTPMVASFSAGSGLLNLDTTSSAQLNAILGQQLGIGISLGVADYNALAAANINAVPLLDQIASQAGVNGTYDDLANRTVTFSQFKAAADTLLAGNPAAQRILDNLPFSNASAPLGQVIDFSTWKKRAIGSIVQQDQGAIQINLFDVITAMARLQNIDTPLTLDLGPVPGISGLLNLKIAASIRMHQPMVSAALAQVGDSISTTQVRIVLSVTADIINLGGLAKGKINLPIYIEAAASPARVVALCQPNGVMARIGVRPQGVKAYLGSVDPAQLADFGQDPSIAAAPVASLELLGVLNGLIPPVVVDASAAPGIAPGSDTESNMDFNADDIASQRIQSVSASDAGHILRDVGDGLQVYLEPPSNAGLIGLLIGLLNTTLSTLTPLVQALLGGVFAILDPVVDALFKTLGLQLGTVDVIVHGVSCGHTALVG